MSRSKRQTRAWHNFLKVWLLAVLGSVSTLVACSEMPTGPVDEVDLIDESLLTVAGESNRFFSVKLIGPAGNLVEYEATVFAPQIPNSPPTFNYVATGGGTRDVGSSLSPTFRFRVGKLQRAYSARIRIEAFQRFPGGTTVLSRYGTLGFWVPANGVAPPLATFTVACNGAACTFDASASSSSGGPIVSYEWRFPDGGRATGAQVTHTYNRPGRHSAWLTIRDSGGGVGQTGRRVLIRPNSPIASFTSTCTSLDCLFDASASTVRVGQIIGYEWDFGDGTAGTGITPAHSYASAGTYDVSLTVRTRSGKKGTLVKQVTTTVTNQAPIATFTNACTDLNCTFDGTASSDPDGSIVGYAWDFGDGNVGTGAAPPHSYSGAGTFDVTLTVTDDQGATGTDTQQVTVAAPNQAPSAQFSASCTNLDCSLDATASSDPDGSIASYAWDFGDGNSGTGKNQTHSYAAAGTYDVTLTVTDDQGATGADAQQVTVMVANVTPTAGFAPSCTNLDCSFDGSASTDPDGSIASYAWNFGDGNSDTGPNPAHSYTAAGTYDVTLTVTDDMGATGTDTQQVIVTAANQLPTAVFTPTCTNLDCGFDGSASSDPDGSVQGYAWDFGDGNSDTGATPSHTYAAAGTYDVTLTVTDDVGATNSDTQQVTVSTANQSPTATFAPSCTDLDCGFDASASQDPDGSIASYVWDFGDGNTGTGATPTHTFAAGGTYDVALTVTDDLGATDIDTQQVTVVAPNQLPTAAFTPGCIGLNCSFNGSASTDPDGSIASYAWDFGDGNSGTGQSPTHSYGAGGTYSVTLTVTDDRGATATDTQQVTATAPATGVNQLGPTIPGLTASEQMGRSAAISDDGNRILVGAPNSSAGASLSGQVRAFEWSGSAWVQLGQDINGFESSLLLGDDKGIAMSGNGQRIALGTPRSGPGSFGSVIVYELSGNTWVKIGQEIIPAATSQFGTAVSLSTNGSRIAIGGPLGGGRAEVYELVGNSWTQMGASLVGTSPDRLGFDVSLSGDGTRLMASLQGANGGAGRIRVYDWNGSAWTQVGNDMDGRQGFGLNASMSRDGARVVGYSALSGDYAAVFELVGNSWVQMGSEFAIPGAFNVYQNVDLSASGNRLVVGSITGGVNSNGTVSIYDWNGSSWAQVGMDVSGDHAVAHLGWSVAISANGGRVVAGMQGYNGPGGNGSGGAKVFTIN